jgi:hypothetical protein
VPVTPHEDPPCASSTSELLPRGDPPEPPEEATPAGISKEQKPVYFVGTMLHDARALHYATKAALHSAYRVKETASLLPRPPYKGGHEPSSGANFAQPNITGWVAEWAMELQPFEIAFETTKVIKSKALAEFTVEWTDPFCRWISCRKNTGYHATDPKDSNAGG